MNYFYIIRGFLLILFSSGLTFAQSDYAVKKSNNISEVQANEIIAQARKRSDPKNITGALKSVEINYEVKTQIIKPNDEVFDKSSVIRLAVELPDKIFYETLTDFTRNQQLFTQILNSDKYSEKSQILIQGKPFNNFRADVKGKNPEVSKEEQINVFTEKTFITLFPVFFQFNLNEKIVFNLIGDGEVNGVKTDVIEARKDDKPLFRIFFDKEQKVPVLITETYFNSSLNKQIEKRTYFSDYREEAGVVVAHRLNIQQGENLKEERLLKNFQINPVLKQNLFEVKQK